ncbi:MAG: NAD(P)/FAD-dependent oxidoreductase [Lachnospiraceae bacterium]
MGTWEVWNSNVFGTISKKRNDIIMKQPKVLVIGGGASGLTAAIAAARNGAQVLIIEQKDRLGKKILSTGNGRCNLTNEYMNPDCYRGEDTSIVSTVLDRFGVPETLSFFRSLGILTRSRNGYIYPLSDQAAAVLDVLRLEVEHLGIPVLLNMKVTEIKQTIQGFVVYTNQKILDGNVVIMATGGKAAPVLGSDGSGYQLAKAFGHSLTPIVPALVQLEGAGTYFKQLAGVRTEAAVTALIDGREAATDQGELQLTDYGISGIPVFQISRYAARGLYEKRNVEVRVDFLPTINHSDFFHLLKERIKQNNSKTSEELLIGIFHKKLAAFLLKQAQIKLQIKGSSLTDHQLYQFTNLCKSYVVPISATKSFDQAQICAGGVKTTEINPHTMESKLIQSLYMTGELMDIDGICGGYNLQWAWATGYIAGESAAKGNYNAKN